MLSTKKISYQQNTVKSKKTLAGSVFTAKFVY